MGPVVIIEWRRLAVCAEVQIITDSTLVTIAEDEKHVILTQRTITADASVNGFMTTLRSNVDRFIDWNKSMPRVALASGGGAGSTVIPIWATEALVANANDSRVTAITDGVVTSATARSEQSCTYNVERSILRCWCESVHRVVTMFLGNMARKTDIIVFTGRAGHEALLWEGCNAAVASACLKCRGWLRRRSFRPLLALVVFGRARNDTAKLESTLDKPVVTLTVYTVIDTGCTKVVVTLVTD